MSGRTAAAAAALAALTLTACVGTEGGNPVAAQLALSAYSSDPAAIGVGHDAASARVDVAWMVVRDLKLERALRCDTGTLEKVVLAGARAVQLAPTPDVSLFEPDGDPYCRLVLKVDDTTDAVLGDAPPELALHSLLLSGARADGAPFALRSRQKLDVELRSRTEPFRVDAEHPALVLGLDLAALLGTLDLAAAELEPDGSVLVDEDHNRDLLDAFDRQLALAMKLFRDGDADGFVSEAERVSPIAE